jgi:hypothetical protein
MHESGRIKKTASFSPFEKKRDMGAAHAVTHYKKKIMQRL